MNFLKGENDMKKIWKKSFWMIVIMLSLIGLATFIAKVSG